MHIRHLDHISSWRFHSFVLVMKHFIHFFASLSVLSRYFSAVLLENKRSLTSTAFSSTKAMISAQLGFLRWRFFMVNSCLFHISLMCYGHFEIIKDNVSGKSRTLQLWLDVILWYFWRKLWYSLNDDESSAFPTGHLLFSLL